MFPVTVKGSVNKFDLGYLMVQEKLQFLPYHRKASQPNRFIDGGQTVAAAIGTASAGFVINDPVGEWLQVMIQKRQSVQIG